MSFKTQNASAGLLYLVANQKYRQLESFLRTDSHIDINCTDSDGQNALFLALRIDRMDIRNHIVRTLLKNNIDVNQATKVDGLTPLMLACQSRTMVDNVRMISKARGLQVNIQDTMGQSALMYAILAKNSSAISILVKSSWTSPTLDTEIQDKNGITPLEQAISLGHIESIRVLTNEVQPPINTENLPPKYQLELSDIQMKYRSPTDSASETRPPQLPELSSSRSSSQSLAPGSIQVFRKLPSISAAVKIDSSLSTID